LKKLVPLAQLVRKELLVQQESLVRKVRKVCLEQLEQTVLMA